MRHSKTTVAVIGAGISGIAAAQKLGKLGYQVVLIENRHEIGGDCRSLRIDFGDAAPFDIDIGVNDFNQTNFVNFSEFLTEIGAETRPIIQDASFATINNRTLYIVRDSAVQLPTGSSVKNTQTDAIISYDGVKTDSIAISHEIDRLKSIALEVLSEDRYKSMSIDEYLKYRNFSEAFAQFYFSPRAFGCFAAPKATLAEYPIASIIRFWRMHGLVGSQLSNGLIGSPTNNRRCVVGGMHRYTSLAAIHLKKIGVSVMTDTSVIQVNEIDNSIFITLMSKDKKISTIKFDHVVIAVKPDQILDILPKDHVISQLLRIAYPTQKTRVVVHCDSKLMPSSQSDWCAYNYIVSPQTEEQKLGTITYWPARIGQLQVPRSDVFVSINPHREPEQSKVFADYMFIHPVFRHEDLSDQRRLMQIQGTGNMWICGSFIEEPFLHEQAFVSGLNVAELLHSRISNLETVVMKPYFLS